MFETLATTVLHRTRAVAAVLITGFIVAVAGFMHLQVDLSFRAFFGSDDPANEHFQEFLAEWGADDDLMLLVVSTEEGSVLEPDRARFLDQVGRELEALPTIQSVTHAFNAPLVLGEEPGLIDMAPVLDSMPDSQGPAWDTWKGRVLSSRLMVPTLISEDERTAGVLVEAYYESGDIQEISPIVAGVQAIVDRHQGHLGMTLGLAGMPPVRAAFIDQFFQDQTLFLPLALVFISCCLFVVFRRLHGVLVPGLAATLPVAMVFGVMGWMGEPIGMLSQTLIMLLPAIAIADAIHVVSRFHEELRKRGPNLNAAGRRDAVRTAAIRLGRACLLTSFTTSIGFLSLYMAKMPILRSFGLYAALGILFAYLGVLFFVPIALTLTRGSAPTQNRADDPTPGDRVLLACANFSLRRPAVVLSVTALVTVAALLYGQRVVVDNNLTQTLQSDHPVTTANVHADAHLGGIIALEVDLEGEPESLKRPDVIAALLDLEQELLARPNIPEATSPASWVALLHQATLGTYEAPDSSAAAAQFYLLAEGDPSFLRQINPEYSKARMRVSMRDEGGRRFEEESSNVQRLLDQHLEGLPLEARLTGTPYVAYRGINGVTEDLRNSLLLAFLTITLVIGLLFRDLRTGMLCLLPNALPLIVGYGVMGLMGWMLDPTPAVVFTVALGIAVDDTLHLMIRTKEELAEGRSREDAIRTAVLHSGRAVAITSLILMFAFGIHGLSSFKQTAIMGGVGATVMFTALLCDLFVLPSLLALWGPGDRADREGLTLRLLTPEDVPTLWRINEEGLPGVGEVSEEALADLLSLAELPLGAWDGDELVGFVLCLLPGTRYGSLNYAWFNERYDAFLYVDRIAVAERHRDRQVGGALYARVIAYAEARGWPVAAEVSLKPPNPGSMRFHGRHGFVEVGKLHHPYQSVTMVMRAPALTRAG